MNNFCNKHGLLCSFVGFAILGVAALALIVLCARLVVERTREGEPNRIKVLVAVAPLAYLAERVGGDAVEVVVLTPPGKDPESYSPTPAEVAEIAETAVFFRVGLEIEDRFAANIAALAPDSREINLGREFRELREKNADREPDDHDDHDAGGHSHSGIDPHVWTSPAQARRLVQEIATAFATEIPENSVYFYANAKKFDAELAALQRELAEKLAPLAGKAFFVFHPAYGYFAEEFGLTQLAVETDGKSPRPQDLARLVETARDADIRAVIVQPEFNRAAAQNVANAVGAELIVHSPLDKEYFANLRALADAVVASYPSEPADPAPNPEQQ